MATLDLAQVSRFSVGFLVLLLDQGVKRWAVTARPDVITKNLGVSLGLGEGIGLWLTMLGWAILILALVLTWRKLGQVPPLPAGLLFFGALSNTLDRVTSGAVIDYIKIGPVPPFNLADVAIVAGAILLVRATLKASPVPSSP